MLKREYFGKHINGKDMYRTYSDDGFFILQHPTEIKYVEAVDLEDAEFTYEETDEKIETEPIIDFSMIE